MVNHENIKISKQIWKVGELAKSLGLSVRTLHYYDDLGLLKPLAKSTKGYRLYGPAEISKLQVIVGLKALGLSLVEIQQKLDSENFSPLPIILQSLEYQKAQILVSQRLIDHLTLMAEYFRQNRSISTEQFISLIKITNMVNTKNLKQTRKKGSTVAARETDSVWTVLMAKVKSEMAKGTDPKSPAVQILAREWNGRIREAQSHPDNASREMLEYIQRALQ